MGHLGKVAHNLLPHPRLGTSLLLCLGRGGLAARAAARGGVWQILCVLSLPLLTFAHLASLEQEFLRLTSSGSKQVRAELTSRSASPNCWQSRQPRAERRLRARALPASCVF